MKLKKVLFIFAICISTLSYSQQKGDFSAFFGASYQLTNNADMGINAGFEYVFLGNTAFAPSFSYYFSANGITTYSINLDMRYYLTYGAKIKYYGIGGFNYLTVKSGGVTSNNIGFNAGGGVIFELNDKVGILGQLKYDSAGATSIEPMIGVTYSF
ncbi:hypothetical protein [Polaribacter gochangensis]|uniref:hypothetical protein n=1 Tax=Polaribacter gochangensis TaxID=3252903 RepID=UPI0039047EDD